MILILLERDIQEIYGNSCTERATPVRSKGIRNAFEASNSLKNAIARLVRNEARLAERLDTVATRLPNVPESVRMPVPQTQPRNPASSDSPAVETLSSNHQHSYIDDQQRRPY